MYNRFIILVTQRNAAPYIRKCLDSVLMQTYKNYEVIIMDDDSDDGTWEGIRNYIDYENIPVILVASGRDGDYKTEGFSHFGGDDNMFLMFKNIVFIKYEINYSLRDIIYSRKPVYLNLKR